MTEVHPPVCDYEGSTYRTDFWEEQGREYEDLVERIALRYLLPSGGGRLLEIGAGFGRLTDCYHGYNQIVLLDYSRSMLRQAQERLGQSERYLYVAANLYSMPFVDGLFDAATLIRTIHHVQDVPAALKEVRRVLRPQGVFILEFANKRHLKAILRYLLRRQQWNPFAPEPVEFAELNFDFHPAWILKRLQEAGFTIEAQRAVSLFRLPLLKRLLPAGFLARLDGLLQRPLAELKPTPSVFLRARSTKQGTSASNDFFFRCPVCHSTDLRSADEALACQSCGRHWAVRDGLYDFKEPVF